ncbi:hypothetical protein HAD_08550 [Hyphomonas adhaerens MHS-3]|uniref:MobA-like NTP transferase domain-containing protein n=1 Tax=Hyphomonas adhaerens MHS-3 TaxID=1280949 RepID=A0A069E9E1_9PROT|nr:NTP transferase domain-containing protein [Hyphomonas adhaerens]KCZ85721.1 hypothetical protein HAD_08550 [Hyphomonas adhaerens MHS-3]
MQIVIPMSGFGERFRRAGYDTPKPLIPVDGKPIIAHVLDMFPGETDVVFICNKDHLSNPDYRMAEILRRYCPTGKIVAIPPHKLGPVNAVLLAREAIDPDKPVVVNYCDFTCYWDYKDFRRFVTETDCDGCVPAYRGFHPHSLGSTFYAYMKHTGLWMDDIQEKKPWTDDPPSEYASSGTYYFRSGALCLETLEKQVRQELDVNGEYYVSLAYRVLKQGGYRTAIYDLQHFMQWGTPEDLAEYVAWSKAFRRLAVDDAVRPRHGGTLLVPMAGLGKRFADEGYAQVKPLIPVSGRPMAIQATRDLPEAHKTVFVLRRDIPGVEEIELKLLTSFVGAETVMLDEVTEGQAITCKHGLSRVAPDQPVTVGACDNGMLYDPKKFEAAMAGDADVLVWTVRGHVDGKMRPKQFGWVQADKDGAVRDVLVKEAPEDPATAPMIVGAFTFRRASDFAACIDALVDRDGRVNGEFYVDSLIADAVAKGLNCQIFEIDHYIGWGTPNDLKTFEYWQSCFHKWPSHPYKLQNDRRIPGASIGGLADRYAATVPDRPEGVSVKTAEAKGTANPLRQIRSIWDLVSGSSPRS